MDRSTNMLHRWSIPIIKKHRLGYFEIAKHSRIIANCIIYYNSALLSGLVEKFEKENNQEVINLIAGLSPVAWRHIQLAGNYIFGVKKDNIVLERLLENLDPVVEDNYISMVA